LASPTLSHLNGNLLCGIDIETTGLDFERHDIYEIAIIPVNGEFKRDKERKWLDLKIRPSRPENIEWDGMHKVKNANRVKDALATGLDSSTAVDIIEHWFAIQNLGTKRIAPIGHNYSFEARFLRAWLGHLNYDNKFADYEIRDTMVIGRFINDMCDFRAEKFIYPKCSLSYLANILKVEHDYGNSHTALGDTATTIDVYRREMEELNKKMIFPA
jgi:DNA polymerase III epsilon subunit-like protein